MSQPKGHAAIDYDAFHAYLYRKADQRGIIRVPVSKLAQQLGVSSGYISQVLHALCVADKAERVAWGTYRIQPPEEPQDNAEPEPEPNDETPRTVMWE